MNTIQITLNDKSQKLPQHCSVHEALISFGLKPELPLIGAKHNNYLKGLRASLSTSGKLEPVLLDSALGHRIYRKSLCFLLNMAAHRTLNLDPPRISHSLGDAYFFYPSSAEQFKVEDIKKLKKKMEELVAENHPIHSRTLSHEQALD
ncbi:MAG: nucleoside kinase, partial [Spirochaetaceae bacterium]